MARWSVAAMPAPTADTAGHTAWMLTTARGLLSRLASRPNPVATRTQRKTVTFDRPFLLKGMDKILPPGNYVVVTDEDLVEGLSFPVYRRVSTTMMAPAQNRPSSVEMLTIDPSDLEAAQERDAAMGHSSVSKTKPATP
jgi:hypothetical protein